MKLKITFLCLFLTALSSIGFAQSKTALSAPEKIVKDLFAAQKNEKTNPFFQTKSRVLVDKYFSKDLGDLIWKDAVAAKGEVGALDFDPLTYSQDPQITNFVIGKPNPAVSPDFSTIPVTFKNNGKAEKIEFETMREKGSIWKVYNIHYSDGEDLQSILRYGSDAEFRKEYDENPYKGDYMVGNTKCTFTPTLNGFRTRIECAGQKGFKFYEFEGSDTENTFVPIDDKNKLQGKFVFKSGQQDGVFIDAAGKKTKVTKVKMQAKTCSLNLEITANNKDGMPLQGASATALNLATNKIIKSVPFEGFPVLPDLSEGKHKITVTLAGYKTLTKEYNLDCSNLEEDDQSVTEYISLQKAAGK